MWGKGEEVEVLGRQTDAKINGDGQRADEWFLTFACTLESPGKLCKKPHPRTVNEKLPDAAWTYFEK